ncbi:MAG: DNA mismatch repair protein MutL, partial [Sporomusaceae bacterium]|nr:DNA mismatch repair protein MutL [Sporomusaceae bacterium]
SEAENSIRQILEFIQNMHNPTAQELRHNCLQIAACRAAIKAGESLNMRQMQALINELCNTNLPYTCPHGRPAMIRFSSHDLDKMFKRTGF